ncbi:MAG: GTP-binding protein, partial [Clostridia bacterium]|nr:GTP-binding protein [Clostridia bacterium]
MKNLTIGLLAHVDAGKTTLAEALLYTAGKIRKPGRVDWRNTYLDTHELERERGITIFSKEARFETGGIRVTLLDTPGHADFSAEVERTLRVLDYAVLVVSGSEGVQAHTETLWELLERYRVPAFLFVTKMDVSQISRAELISSVTSRLSPAAVDFSKAGSDPSFDEKIALCDEELFERYMAGGAITSEDRARLVKERKLFPVFFGSGLKLEGIGDFLEALGELTLESVFPGEFGARVYKIGHDSAGGRLTWMRVTGGTLRNRQTVRYEIPGQSEPLEEKITGIRLYSGTRFDTAESVNAGEVCAVAGLSATYSG